MLNRTVALRTTYKVRYLFCFLLLQPALLRWTQLEAAAQPAVGAGAASTSAGPAAVEAAADKIAEPSSEKDKFRPAGGDRRIGVSLPLSGSGAVYGLDLQSILLFANRKFGGGRFLFILDDDQCDGKTAAAIAQKFVEVDKVEAVIGYGCSGAALAAAPILEKAQIPVMIVFASSAKLREAGDYIFRSWPSDQKAALELYRYAAKHSSSIALISEQTPYASDFKESFFNANLTGNIEIRNEDFLPGNTDFRSILLRIRSWNPEAILINTQDESGFGIVLKQLREFKWRGDVYGAYWPGSPSLQAELKDLLNDVVFIGPPPLHLLLQQQEGRDLLTEYNSPLRSTEAVFVSAIDGFKALAEALNSGQDPRRYLYGKSFKGLSGDFSFDSDGEIKGFDFQIQQVKNGRAEPVADK